MARDMTTTPKTDTGGEVMDANRRRPLWQIALLFLPWILYLVFSLPRAYCDYMDRKFG